MPSIAEHMGIIIPVVGSPLGAAGDLRMVDLHIPGPLLLQFSMLYSL